MRTVTTKEMQIITIDGKPAEMNVRGILRGGVVYNNKFYYTGSVNHGARECEINNTLNIH